MLGLSSAAAKTPRPDSKSVVSAATPPICRCASSTNAPIPPVEVSLKYVRATSTEVPAYFDRSSVTGCQPLPEPVSPFHEPEVPDAVQSAPLAVR
jgi:hypothetical protein